MIRKPTDVHESKAEFIVQRISRRGSVSRLSVSYSTENTPMIAGLGKVRSLLGILCLLYFISLGFSHVVFCFIHSC